MGLDWFAVDDSSALVQIGSGGGRPVVRLELWDGPPPAGYGLTPQVREPIRLRLPTGRLKVLHLPPGEAGIEEIRNGMIPLVRFPPGDYHAWLSKRSEDDRDQLERYLVQFWPAGTGTMARSAVVHRRTGPA